MKALYVGILTDGTTSKMRADTLRSLTPNADWTLIDTDEKFRGSARIWKSTAFRLKSGILVSQVNRQVVQQAGADRYDLVWVDKGVYLWPNAVEKLRQQTSCLVHFTPDTAFFANRSRHFEASAPVYDLLVTTKSFELDEYSRFVDRKRVYLATQAYDSNLHRPPNPGSSRKQVAVFIGLCESEREKCIATLIGAGVPVRLGGRGWGKFLNRYSGHAALHFLGESLFGKDYVAEYAGASVGLGLLSKRFPELHTTRTFEIPACGAMLATERNVETERFFNDDEVLFFNSYDELAINLKAMFEKADQIDEISKKGRQRILADGRDYAAVLSKVLNQIERI